MIVGNGSLAKLLKDRDGAILFASGISNSTSFTLADVHREYSLLTDNIIEANDEGMSLFYFSSISVFHTQTAYSFHKKMMEELIKKSCGCYHIIRLGNIWECTNPSTFVNYLKAHPDREVKDEYRYMISAEQLNSIVQSLPFSKRGEISVFGEMLKVKECLSRYV